MFCARFKQHPSMLGYTAPPSLMQCSIHPVCWSKYTTIYFSGVGMYNSLFFKCTVDRQCIFYSKVPSSGPSNIVHFGVWSSDQISAKRGTKLRFVVEANLKSLCPKSSRGSILKSQNHVYTKHKYQPSSKMVDYHP